MNSYSPQLCVSFCRSNFPCWILACSLLCSSCWSKYDSCQSGSSLCCFSCAHLSQWTDCPSSRQQIAIKTKQTSVGLPTEENDTHAGVNHRYIEYNAEFYSSNQRVVIWFRGLYALHFCGLGQKLLLQCYICLWIKMS